MRSLERCKNVSYVFNTHRKSQKLPEGLLKVSQVCRTYQSNILCLEDSLYPEIFKKLVYLEERYLVFQKIFFLLPLRSLGYLLCIKTYGRSSMHRTYLECLLSLDTLVKSPMEGLTRPKIFGRLQEVVLHLKNSGGSLGYIMPLNGIRAMKDLHKTFNV